MSIQATEVMAPSIEEVNPHRHFGLGHLWQRQAAVGQHFIEQSEPEPRPYPEVDLLEALTPGQASKHLLFVPKAQHHLLVGFSDNTEFVISFDGRVYDERDDLNSYAVPEIWNLHLDGIPVSEGDLDFALPEGIATLENWLLEREGLE